MTDDQPVPDHFWDGSFTLAPDLTSGTEPDGTALDDLGPSGIRLGGRDLATVLAADYRRMVGADPGVR